MNDSLFEQIQSCAKYLNLDLNTQEIAQLSVEQGMDEAQERKRTAIGRTFLGRQMGGPATLEESAGKT